MGLLMHSLSEEKAWFEFSTGSVQLYHGASRQILGFHQILNLNSVSTTIKLRS
jgi:hypothetical protein